MAQADYQPVNPYTIINFRSICAEVQAVNIHAHQLREQGVKGTAEISIGALGAVVRAYDIKETMRPLETRGR